MEQLACHQVSSEAQDKTHRQRLAAALERAEALLFDLDGTLIDSSGSTRRAWSAFAVRHGLDPEEVVESVQGQPSRESVRRLAPDVDPVFEQGLVEQAELADTEGIVALPGALAALNSDKKVAIVTSCTDALAAVRIGAAGLPRPEVVITADRVSNGKPDPEAFLLGAHELGVNPSDCIVFEDAPAGIAAGKAAGALVVGLRTTHSVDSLSEADLLVDDLSELSAD